MWGDSTLSNNNELPVAELGLPFKNPPFNFGITRMLSPQKFKKWKIDQNSQNVSTIFSGDADPLALSDNYNIKMVSAALTIAYRCLLSI